MSKKIKMEGVVPEPQNGLKDFQEKNGTFDPYKVAPVAKTDEYETKSGKTGLVHVDDQGKKHAWPLAALSRESEKVKFINGNKPAKVGEKFTSIEVPDRMGRGAMGEMLT